MLNEPQISLDYLPAPIDSLMQPGIGPREDCRKDSDCGFAYPAVLLAKQVSRFIGEQIGKRIIIEPLADAFYLSPTQRKSSFRGVYRDRIHASVRCQKLQKAAGLLALSDQTVMEIAGKVARACVTAIQPEVFVLVVPTADLDV